MNFVVREYLDESGRSPFRTWLGSLDKSTRARVQARILRFETGNLGDHKELGNGVWEARLAFGPGYRVYFGRRGRELVSSAAGRRQRKPGKGHQTREGILGQLREGTESWQDEVKTGTKV